MSANTKAKTKRYRLGSPLIPVVLAALSVILLASAVFCKAAKIIVIGASRYSGEEIAQASGVQLGSSTLLLPSEKIAKAITDKFPYISQVIVKGSFSDTIEITVTEEVPKAFITVGGEFLLIDRFARGLEAVSQKPAGLVEVSGVTLTGTTPGKALMLDAAYAWQAQIILNVIAGLEANGIYGSVPIMSVGRRDAISFNYESRFTVIIRNGQNAEKDIATFLASLDQKPEEITSGVAEVTENNEVLYSVAR
ncbi:MAG: FtsQ-type POTRA domain-containing protein [Oscillospiraceae bacterium]|jgi:hypothetical protein|nr:FtsQ-type POTRA domain-containing protein [Oscillospiraceae bacterium]